MAYVDYAVVGAGVVGLAIARELSGRSGASVIILEKNRRPGQEISSRNSEVIHSGIYYSSSMLKSRLCVLGREQLYHYCGRHRVPSRKCGKLLVACDDSELSELERLAGQAGQNGVVCSRLDRVEIKRLEPDIMAAGALYLPDSGTIDAHSLVKSLQYDACIQGTAMVLDCQVDAVHQDDKYYVLHSGRETIRARYVINAAGLGAERLAAAAGIDTDEAGYRLHPCKGEYFKLRSRWKISHLIYPVPTQRSLGIHLSFDLSGRLRLGPSAEYVEEIDYAVDESHREHFYQAASRYLPALAPEDVSPDFAGIRPKLQGPGEPMRDFVIAEESGRGLPGWVNLIGIESPGLTSCLAIGQYVAALLP